MKISYLCEHILLAKMREVSFKVSNILYEINIFYAVR